MARKIHNNMNKITIYVYRPCNYIANIYHVYGNLVITSILIKLISLIVETYYGILLYLCIITDTLWN